VAVLVSVRTLALGGVGTVLAVASIAWFVGGPAGPKEQARPPTLTTRTSVVTTSNPTTSIQSTTSTLPVAERLFLDAVGANLRVPGPFDTTKNLTDAYLLSDARELCETTPKGLPPDEYGIFKGRTPPEYLVDNGDVRNGTPYGERTKLAIKFLCPENQPYLDQALSGRSATPKTQFPDGSYTIGGDLDSMIPAGTYE